VAAIILGVVLGGALFTDGAARALLSVSLPFLDTHIERVVALIGLIYIVAAVINLYVPDTGVDHKPLKKNPFYLMHEFGHCVALLWRDRLGQISLAVTTLFWGAAAALQLIVIKWAEDELGLAYSSASMLQGAVAVGVAIGATLAARFITLGKSVRVIPLGIAMGFVVLTMNFVSSSVIAIAILMVIGALSGFFVVPMNALLQHRGHILMGAGHSIAVQNFNENISVLLMAGVYFLMLKADMPISWVVALFGLFVSGIMYLIRFRHLANQRLHDDVAHLDDGAHDRAPGGRRRKAAAPDALTAKTRRAGNPDGKRRAFKDRCP
jgi:hypothetical protein